MRRALAAFALALTLPAAQAGEAAYCGLGTPAGAAAVDRLLAFAAVAEAVLDQQQAQVAVIARAGLDLSRFGLRYSHAGLALRAGAGWQVRQLYYDCEHARPHLYDQGLAGFTLGNARDDPAFLSVVFVPGDAGARLSAQALEAAPALAVLGTGYSANAYAFSTRYQNCNQWVAELMARAWGAPEGAQTAREAAQAWLREAGYRPRRLRVSNPFVRLGGHFVPSLHDDDHPPRNREAGVFEVSMPASLEAFVRARVPGARRVELCLRDTRVVLHEGWDALDAACVPGPADAVVSLRGAG
ncbi:MAG: DUF2145 domain-containing protein [Candidatus Dactylopiibacterium sp.]|nr:DUF2145 domain-containing protein [Candidatus Dactylopiibacterium sp.]